MYRLNKVNNPTLFHIMNSTLQWYEYAVEVFQPPGNDVASDFSFSINIIHQDSSGSVNIFVVS